MHDIQRQPERTVPVPWPSPAHDPWRLATNSPLHNFVFRWEKEWPASSAAGSVCRLAPLGPGRLEDPYRTGRSRTAEAGRSRGADRRVRVWRDGSGPSIGCSWETLIQLGLRALPTILIVPNGRRLRPKQSTRIQDFERIKQTA